MYGLDVKSWLDSIYHDAGHGLDVKSWLDSIYHDAGRRQLVLPPHQSVQGSIIIVIDGNLLHFIQNSTIFHNY
jgi:hypothetical protein